MLQNRFTGLYLLQISVFVAQRSITGSQPRFKPVPSLSKSNLDRCSSWGGVAAASRKFRQSPP